MPPEAAPQPAADVRQRMVGLLHRDIENFDYSTIDDPGFELMRRLTHDEYDNTVRDSVRRRTQRDRPVSR